MHRNTMMQIEKGANMPAQMRDRKPTAASIIIDDPAKAELIASLARQVLDGINPPDKQVAGVPPRLRVTVDEFCAITNMSRVKEWKLRRAGVLEYCKEGVRIYYLPDQIARYLVSTQRPAKKGGRAA